jgi:hypothetical protein
MPDTGVSGLPVSDVVVQLRSLQSTPQQNIQQKVHSGFSMRIRLKRRAESDT